MKTDRQAALDLARKGKRTTLEFASDEDGNFYVYAEGHMEQTTFADAVRALAMARMVKGFLCDDCEVSRASDSEQIKECRDLGHSLRAVTWMGLEL